MVDYRSPKFCMVISVVSVLLLPLFVTGYPMAQEDYNYLSTGVGKESRQEKIPQDFSIKMVFASTRGELLANVKVDVADREGQRVFSVVSEGPWLFVDLPQGVYNIAATFRKCLLKREGVKISSGFTAEVVMRWDLESKGGCR